jgi:hypothetical protein
MKAVRDYLSLRLHCGLLEDSGFAAHGEAPGGIPRGKNTAPSPAASPQTDLFFRFSGSPAAEAGNNIA